MAIQTVTSAGTLSGVVSTLYEKTFLERANYQLIYQQGAQKRSLDNQEGYVVKFSRYEPKGVTKTPLTEGTNPAETSITTSTVTATLAEYGDRTTISRFASLTAIDRNNQEAIGVQGQQMGETLDELVRDELFSGATVQFAAGRANNAAITASDVFGVDEIRKAVRTLELNKAPKYDDGLYWGKTSPRAKFDLVGDSKWQNMTQYKDNEDNMRTNDIGLVYGVKLYVTPNPKTEASTVTVYSNFVHGANAFGVYDLQNDSPKLYITPHTKIDSNNPTGAFSIVAWRGSFVAKVLNANWLINVKSGAS